MSYHSSIIRQTEENDNFRTVLFTGKKSQLMVMSIPPGGVIGMETHEHVEQTLFFLSGSGKAVLNGEESAVVAGDVVVVTPGTEHNIINDGDEPLKVYTIYAPPNHIDGRIHATKADADADTEDEAFGHAVR
jgi:mannose-6-phosphate isomerase-like protein (cupin superfamily)